VIDMSPELGRKKLPPISEIALEIAAYSKAMQYAHDAIFETLAAHVDELVRELRSALSPAPRLSTGPYGLKDTLSPLDA
jgi:hypothetical protein